MVVLLLTGKICLSRGPPGTVVPGPPRDIVPGRLGASLGQLSRDPPGTAWDICPGTPPGHPETPPETLSRDPPGTVVFNVLNASVVLVCLVFLGFCLVFASSRANPNTSDYVKRALFLCYFVRFCAKRSFSISNVYSKKHYDFGFPWSPSNCSLF